MGDLGLLVFYFFILYSETKLKEIKSASSVYEKSYRNKCNVNIKWMITYFSKNKIFPSRKTDGPLKLLAMPC